MAGIPNSNCKCEGLPPCMGTAARLNTSNNAPQQQGGGCPADYNNGGGNGKQRGGCPGCSQPPPPQQQQQQPKGCKPPQAKPDPAQTLFDRYNLCCPGQKCPPPEPGPQCSTGRKLKLNKNGFDLYDSEIPKPSC